MAVVPQFSLALDLAVSALCLGTMTFGEQNSLSDSFRLLDFAFSSSINFFNSAKMYPVPQRADIQGRSEEYLGCWIRDQRIPRDRLIVATKFVAVADRLHDLYQIHWPDRYEPMFGEFDYNTSRQFAAVPVEEQLKHLEKLLHPVKYAGLSNETPYGIMKFLHIAEKVAPNLKIISVQGCNRKETQDTTCQRKMLQLQRRFYDGLNSIVDLVRDYDLILLWGIYILQRNMV